MYKRIPYFFQNYAREGVQEQRAVHDFVICENREALAGLRAELTGIVQGNPKEEELDKVIGLARKKRYGSYKEWAKLILLWLANTKE